MQGGEFRLIGRERPVHPSSTDGCSSSQPSLEVVVVVGRVDSVDKWSFGCSQGVFSHGFPVDKGGHPVHGLTSLLTILHSGRHIPGLSTDGRVDEARFRIVIHSLSTSWGQRTPPLVGKGRPTSHSSGLRFDPAREVGDLIEQAAPLRHELANLAVSMHDSGVVPTAESLTDLRQ